MANGFQTFFCRWLFDEFRTALLTMGFFFPTSSPQYSKTVHFWPIECQKFHKLGKVVIFTSNM